MRSKAPGARFMGRSADGLMKSDRQMGVEFAPRAGKEERGTRLCLLHIGCDSTRCSTALGRVGACAGTAGQDDRCPPGSAAVAALDATICLESYPGMVSEESSKKKGSAKVLGVIAVTMVRSCIFAAGKAPKRHGSPPFSSRLLWCLR